MSLLSTQGLVVSLGKRQVINGASINFQAGRFYGLVGPNGAGKTSLLKTLVGLIKPTSGEMSFRDQNLANITVEQRARKIAYLAQDRTAHWPLLTERVVALGRFPHRAHWQALSDEDDNIVHEAMKSADVLQFKGRKIDTLSGGEVMRVLLARAIAVQAEVLLADEPVSALDPAHALAVMQLLQRESQGARSVVAVMHDLTLAARFCHELILMDKGNIIAQGAPLEVLSTENLKQVYNIKTYNPADNEHMILPWDLC